MDYKQPDFYHFSRDSIVLAELAAQELLSARDLNQTRLLDIGAGCGVIGLEVARRISYQCALYLCLLEKQKEFFPFIEHNMKNFLPRAVEGQVIRGDFFNFKPEQAFTHIVCNPPYFFENEGRPSSWALRQACRSWPEVEAREFIKKIVTLCREDQATAFLSGRAELVRLFEELGVDYQTLDKMGATSFYRLF